MSKPDTDDGRARCEKQDFEVGYGKPPKATRFNKRAQAVRATKATGASAARP